MTALVDLMCAELGRLGEAAAVEVANAWLDDLTVVELAALLYDWDHTWAREEQLFPSSRRWRSHGFLSARRVGKTSSCANFIHREVRAGRAQRIGFMAQTEDKTIEVMVLGEVGLVASSPPWFRATWERGRVVWPNGAQAFPFTPEKPGNIRGPGVHLFWASEIQSWPSSTREEAWANAQIMTSLGMARTVWDATPKRRHPILRLLLDRARRHPEIHGVVRGDIWSNADNLGEGVVEDLEAELGGTQRGDEELRGLFFDEAEGALWKQEWIDKHRRERPPKLARTVIAIDPAITFAESSDPTGMVAVGALGPEAFVLANWSQRFTDWDTWGDVSVSQYLELEADLIIVETNRGGKACSANIARAARDRGLTCVVFDEKHRQRTTHNRRVVYVLEVVGRKAKEVRAEPVAAQYKKGRAHHVEGGEGLSGLEDSLTTWEPDGKHESPNDLDALVYGVSEVLDLSSTDRDPKRDVDGIEILAKKLRETEGDAANPLRPRGGRTI